MKSHKLNEFSGLSTSYSLGRKKLPDDVVKFISQINGSKNTVLDLGCGTGISTNQLNTSSSLVIIGIDINADMISVAEHNLFKESNISFIVSGANEIPLESLSVDIVYCVRSFHWFAKASSVKEIYRIIKDNGLFVIVDKNEVSQVKEDFKELIRPFLTRNLPDAKDGYNPILACQGNFKLKETKTFKVIEKYSREQSMNYFRSLSWWSFIREDKEEDVVLLLRKFILKKMNGKNHLERIVNVKVTTLIKEE